MNFWLSLSKKSKLILAAVFISLLALGAYFLFFSARGPSEIEEQVVYERGSPVVPSGIQTYEFIQSSTISPRVRFITVDPLDAKPGQIQKFEVVIESSFSTSSVALELRNNLELETIELKKTASKDLPVSRYSVGRDNNIVFAGEKENPSSTISFWEGERIVKSDNSENFSIYIKVKEIAPRAGISTNRSGKPVSGNFERISSSYLSWIKTCNIPLGGDWESSESCTVSNVDGLDGGNAHIINNSTVVLDSDFGVNQDKSIIFQPAGVIAVNIKAEIKQGNIWKLKTDESGTKEVISVKSPGAGYERRYGFSGGGKSSLKEINKKDKPVVSLSPGKQIFQIASAITTGPKIIQATIDPLDVGVGDTQNLSLVVSSAMPIASVVAKIETDNGTIDLPLRLEGKTSQADILPERFKIGEGGKLAFSGGEPAKNISAIGIKIADAASEPVNLTYSGFWVAKDTHSAVYHTSFVVTDADGAQNSILMAWSDPCSTFVGGNRSLNTCSFSDIDGADNGNLTINTSQTVTLQAGATLVFNSGKSLTINGAISIASTAQIKKTNLWITDADADTFPPSVGLTAQDSQPAGKQRAYTTTSTLDCYDGNADANPNSGYSSQRHRGDGSYDYDCNGLETQTELRQIDAYCSDNGTIYPTPHPSAQSNPGWCRLSVSGPGGVNYPLCTVGEIPACGGSNDWYTRNIYVAPDGCVTGSSTGGVYTETKYQECY